MENGILKILERCKDEIRWHSEEYHHVTHPDFVKELNELIEKEYRRRIEGYPLTNEQLQEYAKTNRPPQSWYDEDFGGLT